MTRITAEHLSREAWVYVRQSTPDQVRHNRESRGRQYGLEGRARKLGWREVVVVDDDLRQSGGGTQRAGYDRPLAAVCRGEVGVVLSLEASRFARNGREWHTLIDVVEPHQGAANEVVGRSAPEHLELHRLLVRGHATNLLNGLNPLCPQCHDHPPMIPKCAPLVSGTNGPPSYP